MTGLLGAVAVGVVVYFAVTFAIRRKLIDRIKRIASTVPTGRGS